MPKVSPLETNVKGVRPFAKPTQKLLNWFVFFLAFPSITILGNSITFYLFLAIIYKVGAFWQFKSKGKLLFQLFILVVVAASLFAPYGEMPRHPGPMWTIQLIIQYTYWCLVAMFFVVARNKIDLFQLTKWLFYGCLVAILGFYFLPIDLNLAIFQISFTGSRNGFVFSILASAPLVFYFVFTRYSKAKAYGVLLFFIAAMLFTNGRSGAVIILMQSLLIMGIYKKRIRNLTIIGMAVFLVGNFMVDENTKEDITYRVADWVEPINPRFAMLIKGEGVAGDLSFDKSWLQRKLLIDKGKEVFKKHPITGLGPAGFRFYDASLNSLSEYDRLGHHSVAFYNARSAHNSYLQILIDFGLIGISLLMLIIGLPIVYFIKVYLSGKSSIAHLAFIALIGIAFHFYAISAITGAIAWMVFGLAWAVYINRNKIAIN